MPILWHHGTHRGNDHYGIRSVRSERFKYILNLTPEEEFVYPLPRSIVFNSWLARAAEGDGAAAERVDVVRRQRVGRPTRFPLGRRCARPRRPLSAPSDTLQSEGLINRAAEMNSPSRTNGTKSDGTTYREGAASPRWITKHGDTAVRMPRRNRMCIGRAATSMLVISFHATR